VLSETVAQGALTVGKVGVVPLRGLRAFWSSTVGKKITMAVTGLVMLGFLLSHVTANLLAFLGPEYINRYSRFLHETPELLWPARLILLMSVILHATSAYQLAHLSQAARPVGYRVHRLQVATLASRTIRWFSIALAVFVVVHLLHLTAGRLLPGFQSGDPYHNIVTAFSTQPAMTAFYLAMMAVVGLHVYHGAWSAIRTLGLSRPKANPLLRPVATLVALFLWLGFSSIPIAVVGGLIKQRQSAAAQALGTRQQ
jgi:succinate dehydrogenase / fumarate reductase cytochrome b subunit